MLGASNPTFNHGTFRYGSDFSLALYHPPWPSMLILSSTAQQIIILKVLVPDLLLYTAFQLYSNINNFTAVWLANFKFSFVCFAWFNPRFFYKPLDSCKKLCLLFLTYFPVMVNFTFKPDELLWNIGL